MWLVTTFLDRQIQNISINSVLVDSTAIDARVQDLQSS